MSNNSKDCKDICNNSCNECSGVNPLIESFFSLCPTQFALLSSLLGILLTSNLDLDQQNALGNFIVNVGQMILTTAAQGQVLQGNNFQSKCIRQKIDKLKQQIFELEHELKN